MRSSFVDFSDIRAQSGIYVQCSGGLGNQLFQFALANEIAKSVNVPVALEISHYDLHFGHEGFVIETMVHSLRGSQPNSPSLTRLSKTLMHLNRLSPYFPRLFELLSGLRLQRERMDFHFDSSLKIGSPNTLVSGHWQSLKYFERTRYSFLGFLRSHLGLSASRQTLGERLGDSRDRPVVMVHVRRGDYVANANIHGLVGKEFYSAAIEYMRATLQDPVFLVFSDDADRVKSEGLFESDAQYFDDHGMTSLEVLSFMASCDHFVIANSTFSWWAAAIGSHESSKSIVVSPEKWSSQGSAPELLFPNWRTIAQHGSS